MKIERINEGMLVRNKVNGKFYVVTSIQDGTAVAALSVDSDRKLDEDATVTISTENSICFRIVDDPAYTRVPDVSQYDVVDGILVKNGTPVTEQGDIVVEEIIASSPRCLILSVIKDEKKYIMEYGVVSDHFRTIYESPTKTEVIREEPLVLYLESTELVETDEGVKERFINAHVYAIDETNEAARYIFDAPLAKVECHKNAILAYQDKKTVSDRYLISSDLRVSVNENEYFEDLVDLGKEKAADVCGTYSQFYDAFVLIGERTIVCKQLDVNLSTSFAKDVKGMVLVDKTQKGRDTFLTFSNEKFNVVTLKATSTSDRGTIVTKI